MIQRSDIYMGYLLMFYISEISFLATILNYGWPNAEVIYCFGYTLRDSPKILIVPSRSVTTKL
jgi:hypothetical protein